MKPRMNKNRKPKALFPSRKGIPNQRRKKMVGITDKGKSYILARRTAALREMGLFEGEAQAVAGTMPIRNKHFHQRVNKKPRMK